MARTRRRPVGSAPLAELDWSQGMKRDFARQALPAGAVWTSTDYLHDRPGLVYKRGGTAYFGPAVGTGTYLGAIGYGNYPAGGQVAVIGQDDHLRRVTASAVTDVDFVDPAFKLARAKPSFVTAGVPLTAGVSTGALIFTAHGGNATPIAVFWDGTTMTKQLLHPTSAPTARHSANYKGRLVLGGTAAAPQTLAWAPSADITTAFDPNATIDFDYPITGLAALQNALLVFSDGHTERLIGSDPPPDTDMERGVIGDIGCVDGRSIVVYGDSAIFANTSGVYVTNGAAFDSLTDDEGGIGNYWETLFNNYEDDWRVAAGLYRGRFYVITVTFADGTPLAGFVCDIPRRVWGQLTNQSAAMFASATGAQEELYYADASTNRVVATSGMWVPSNTNKTDADGTPVQPVLETRSLGAGPGLKHFGFGRLTYDLDGAGDTPTLTVRINEGVDGQNTLIIPPESPLTATVGPERRRFGVRRYAQAVSVQFIQGGASATTEIYALEVEAPDLPVGAGGE